VNLPQVTELVFYGEVTHADENVFVDLIVAGVDFECSLTGNFTEHWEHNGRFFSEPDSNSWLLV